MIELHSVPTPNGHKVSIMLAELGLAYELIPYDIAVGDQFKPDLLALNPNNKLPVLVDRRGASPVAVFESGAILIYLAEQAGQLLPASGPQRYACLQWLMFQMSAVGPLQGQAHHFVRYARVPQDYARARYLNETRRQCRVLNTRLGEVEYLAGDYSIADIACWPWIRALRLIDIHIGEDYPQIKRWYKAIEQRPAVQQGKDVIHGLVYSLPANYFMTLDEKTWSNSFGEEQYRVRQPAPKEISED